MTFKYASKIGKNGQENNETAVFEFLEPIKLQIRLDWGVIYNIFNGLFSRFKGTSNLMESKWRFIDRGSGFHFHFPTVRTIAGRIKNRKLLEI